MIRHIVMFKFKDFAKGKTKAENVAIAKNMLEELPAKVDLIKFSSVAVNASFADESNYDLILTSDFDSFEDLQKYIIHPDHAAVGDFMCPCRISRACIDFEI